MYKQKYVTGMFECYVFNLFNSHNILNVCIRRIWFNTTYIIPNFHRTTMQYYCDIGKTLRYLKLYFMQGFIFESRIFIDNDFRTNFGVMLLPFTIFADFIFINLHLLSLKY